MIFFIDNDSTFMKEETFDEVFRLFGDDVYEKVLKKTHASMNGNGLLLEDSLRMRIEILCSQNIKITKSMLKEFAVLHYHFSDGVEGFLQEIIAKYGSLKDRVFILSGGFFECISPRLETLDIAEIEKQILKTQIYCNFFKWNAQNEITGIDWNQSTMWQEDAKRKCILDLKKRKFLIPNEKWVAIGDGSNDIGMIQNDEEGVFYAFIGSVFREKTVQAAKGKVLKSFYEAKNVL